jgi:hypothetical protein
VTGVQTCALPIFFAKIWGPDNGIGVRSAVGFNSLPDNIPVEIEALFELHNSPQDPFK